MGGYDIIVQFFFIYVFCGFYEVVQRVDVEGNMVLYFVSGNGNLFVLRILFVVGVDVEKWNMWNWIFVVYSVMVQVEVYFKGFVIEVGCRQQGRKDDVNKVVSSVCVVFDDSDDDDDVQSYCCVCIIGLLGCLYSVLEGGYCYFISVWFG